MTADVTWRLLTDLARHRGVHPVVLAVAYGLAVPAEVPALYGWPPLPG